MAFGSGGVASDGEEDVVEARSDDADVGELDPVGAECGGGGNEVVDVVVDGDAHRAEVVVDAGGCGGDAVEHACGGGECGRVVRCDDEVAAADALLEVIRGSLCDDRAAVDDGCWPSIEDLSVEILEVKQQERLTWTRRALFRSYIGLSLLVHAAIAIPAVIMRTASDLRQGKSLAETLRPTRRADLY